LWGLNLSVDESLLTGESVAVRKTPADEAIEMGRPGGDDLPFVYSGTMVVQGEGVAVVRAIGAATEIGKIGKALQTVETEETRLQKETRKLVRNLAVIGIALCVLVVLIYGLTRKDWIDGLLAGLAMAMAILPEEFPVVLTIFMALGAWRISQHQVLTRRVPAVETLGSTTVLCVDKTGTLTLNRMSVRKIFARGEFYDLDYVADRPLPETFHEVLEYSILASKMDPFDPMEKAFKQLGDHYLAGTDHLHKNWSLEQEYPLTRKQLAMSHVWKSPDGEDFIIATKGAPEAIFDLCHLNRVYAAELSNWINTMAAEGLRVLGVARAHFKKPVLPDQQHDFDYKFLGLVGLADPIRPNVPAAIRECHEAGIRVIMITGDYPATAQNIGRQIGLKSPEECITGADVCIVATGWEEFKALKPGQFQRLMRSPAVVDGRRIFDPKRFRASGIPFLRVGTAASTFLAREP
jgi:Ca2+-transporting ATPase